MGKGAGTDGSARESLLGDYRGILYACVGYCKTAKGVSEAVVGPEATLGGDAMVPSKVVEAVETQVKGDGDMEIAGVSLPGYGCYVLVSVQRGAFIAAAAAEDFSMGQTKSFITQMFTKLRGITPGSPRELAVTAVREFSETLRSDAESWSKRGKSSADEKLDAKLQVLINQAKDLSLIHI
eukprot:TRINITY_DN22900_c0_g1_i2.p1 TRINITY_DN22900_c0_g1~~TRINITY_DN22900_c0_g1_i2.p1  ORF type:complete len:181 (-),score=42.10 TRINITY_DN22900_c0_g1_i2:147-689(-)